MENTASASQQNSQNSTIGTQPYYTLALAEDSVRMAVIGSDISIDKIKDIAGRVIRQYRLPNQEDSINTYARHNAHSVNINIAYSVVPNSIDNQISVWFMHNTATPACKVVTSTNNETLPVPSTSTASQDPATVSTTPTDDITSDHDTREVAYTPTQGTDDRAQLTMDNAKMTDAEISAIIHDCAYRFGEAIQRYCTGCIALPALQV